MIYTHASTVQKKNASGIFPATLSLLVAALMQASVPAVAVAQGLPTAGVVTQGAATISSTNTNMTIHQSTASAVIDWTSFDIANGHSVNFQVPSSGGATLNQISGPASQINGSLTSNGALFLVNPNGVVFGSGSSVNVGSLVATNSALSSAEFTGTNHTVFTAGGTGTISNAGTITAGSGGHVVLAGAGNINNTGVITVPGGTIQMVSADAFTLTLPTNNPFLDISVDAKAIGQKVMNSGTLSAGTVTLNAAQGAVSTFGVIKATSIGDLKGSVNLSGAKVSVYDSVESDGAIKLTSDGVARIEADLLAANAIEIKSKGSMEVVNSTIESKSGNVELASEGKVFMFANSLSAENGDIRVTGEGRGESKPGAAVNIVASTLVASGDVFLDGQFDTTGLMSAELAPNLADKSDKSGVYIKNSTLNGSEIAIHGTGLDGVFLSGTNALNAASINISGVSPEAFNYADFFSGDGVKIAGNNTFSAGSELNITGTGSRYGVSFNGINTFNVPKINVVGNTTNNSENHSLGITFFGDVGTQYDSTDISKFDFISDGVATTKPSAI